LDKLNFLLGLSQSHRTFKPSNGALTQYTNIVIIPAGDENMHLDIAVRPCGSFHPFHLLVRSKFFHARAEENLALMLTQSLTALLDLDLLLLDLRIDDIWHI
jgi:hypothetical protein